MTPSFFLISLCPIMWPLALPRTSDTVQQYLSPTCVWQVLSQIPGQAVDGEAPCPSRWRQIFKNIYLFILERGEGREKERERNIEVREKHQSIASCTRPIRDGTCNLGMCPAQESNRWLSTLQDDAEPAEPHQSGKGGDRILLQPKLLLGRSTVRIQPTYSVNKCLLNNYLV